MIKVTFLGTSGAVPSIRRNHPAVLLTYGGENILVDCGEGTQRQLKMAKISPGKLTRLLITHWHGDHALGVPGLLQTLSFNNYKRILEIYGPKWIKTNIENVLRAFPSVMVSDMRKNVGMKVAEARGKFIDEKDFYFEAFPISHGIPCNAYSFVEKNRIRIDKRKLRKFKIKPGKYLSKLKEGKDIIYEGKKYRAKDLTFLEKGKKICIIMDGIYEPGNLKYAKDADLLIMEATYEHELEKLAREHKHRTAKQCAEFAKKSNAKKLILTHLSERYEKEPTKILNEAQKVFKNTHLAKDLDVFEI